MKKLLIGMMLLVSVGCTSRYQHQLDQSLLLQENQRLEEALYVTHAQLVDLKRENETLKASRTGDSASSKTVVPAVRSRRTEPASRDDYDEAPLFQTPKVVIPDDAPASESIPDALKGSQRLPRIMPPNKQYATQKESNSTPPEEMMFPVLPVGGENSGDLVPPAWSPSRN